MATAPAKHSAHVAGSSGSRGLRVATRKKAYPTSARKPSQMTVRCSDETSFATRSVPMMIAGMIATRDLVRERTGHPRRLHQRDDETDADDEEQRRPDEATGRSSVEVAQVPASDWVQLGSRLGIVRRPSPFARRRSEREAFPTTLVVAWAYQGFGAGSRAPIGAGLRGPGR